MENNDVRLNVYYPTTIADMLAIRKNRPDGLLYNGGTGILQDMGDRFREMRGALIYLGTVDELSRITLTERYIDIGAAVSLSAVLKLGRRVVPPILRRSLESIASPHIRNLATLAGNLCSPSRIMTAHPVLAVLGASVEIREQGALRTLGLQTFRTARGTALRPEEVVTRIRIPREAWNLHCFRRVGAGTFAADRLVFAALARTEREVIGDMHIAAVGGANAFFRRRDMELELLGRKIPLARRDIDAITESYATLIMGQADLSAFQQERFLLILRWFLLNLR